MKSKNYKSNHALEILEMLNNDRKETKSFCDVTITAGSINDFARHKCVLGVFSNFFSKMFSIDMKEKYERKGKFQKVTEETLEAVLNFIYTCDITVTSENVYNLIEAANFIGIPYLKEFCVDFLLEEVDVTNCVQIRTCSKLYNLQELVEKADCVIANNFETLVNENTFIEVKFEDFKGILELESKQITSEATVYYGIIQWIKHDVDARKQHLTELFNLLKLDDLSGDFLQDVVSQEYLITTSNECLKKCFQSTVSRVRVQLNEQVVIKQRKVNTCILAFQQNQVWEYDIETKQLSCFPNRFIDADHGSVVNHKGEIYIICWNNAVKKLDRNSLNVFSRQIDPLGELSKHRVSVSFSKYIYICGGYYASNSMWLRCTQRYDVNENTWCNVNNLNEARCKFALVCTNKRIYALGGSNKYGPLKTAECYNPCQDGWHMIPPMNVARHGLAAVSLKGKLYAIGGTSNITHRSVEGFDPSQLTWCNLEKIGSHNNQNVKSVERFDPHRRIWCHVAEMNYARYCHGACVLNGKIYVTGGGPSIVEVYDPEKNIWEVEANITSFQTVHYLTGI